MKSLKLMLGAAALGALLAGSAHAQETPAAAPTPAPEAATPPPAAQTPAPAVTPAPGVAQQIPLAPGEVPPLTQTYTVGDWQVSIPEGWLTNDQALPLVANGQAAITTMQYGDLLIPGSIAIGIVPPDRYGVFGITPSTSAEETIANLVTIFGGEGEVTPFEGTMYTALIRPLAGSSVLPPESMLIAYEVEGGVISFVVVAHDFEGLRPLVTAMIDSTAPAP